MIRNGYPKKGLLVEGSSPKGGFEPMHMGSVECYQHPFNQLNKLALALGRSSNYVNSEKLFSFGNISIPICYEFQTYLL